MKDDYVDFNEESIENELRYMHLEGLVNVEFHPNYPGSYKHAVYRWRSEKEIQAEIDSILNS